MVTLRTAVTSALAIVGTAATLAACTSGSESAGTDAPARPSTSVPVSANVVAPAGLVDRTPTGTTLAFGASAYLPADAFRPAGQLAMFTVTGIEPGSASELPESVTHGGTPFYVHVTVTQLANRQLDVPSVVGLAGSSDGRTATLTETPPDNFDKCRATEAPRTLGRGNSYATCFVAVADKGVDLTRVIYWAQTSTDPSADYKAAPVVWSDGSPAAPASSPATTG